MRRLMPYPQVANDRTGRRCHQVRATASVPACGVGRARYWVSMKEIGTRRFVDRDIELAQFAWAVEGARRGTPAVLLVGGEAGIGKSSLVREGAARAGIASFLGRSVQVGGQPLPLSPLIDLIRQIGRRQPRGLLDQPAFTRLTRLTRASAQLNGDSAGGIFDAVLGLVGALGADTAVLAGFEDLHWADGTTWDVFEFLVRNLLDEHVVLVGTYRTPGAGLDPHQRRRLAELSRLPGVHRVQLEGLTRTDVEAQVSDLMAAQPPRVFIEQLMARAQGNPYFTEELVSAHAQGDALPPQLADLVAADLAACRPSTRAALAVLATIGRDTSHDFLAAILTEPEPTVEQAVHEAVSAQLVAVDRDTGHYRFRHPLVGEVVYDGLLPSERGRLHKRVAQALQERRQPGAALDIGELAVHLDKAGDRAGALAASIAAADSAENLAPAAALTHLERALSLWGDNPPNPAEHARRLWQAADLASATGANQRAAQLSRTALALGDPPRGRAWGYERLGRFLWANGELDEAARAYEQAASLVSADDRTPGAASAFAGLAQASLMRCQFPTAERWSRRALDICGEGGGTTATRVSAQHVLGLVHCQRGDHRAALEICQDAVAATDGVPLHVHLLAVVYLVMALMGAGRYQDAVNIALDGTAEAQRAGLAASHAAYLTGAAAESLVRLGRWRQADSLLHSATGLDLIPIASNRILAARTLLTARRGEAGIAQELIDVLLATPVGAYHQALAWATCAESHLALGNWAGAHRAAETLAAMKTSPISPAKLAMLTVTATVEMALDNRARGNPMDAAATARRLTRSIPAPRRVTVTTPGTSLEAAHLAHAQAAPTLLTGADPGRWREAAKAWDTVGDPWAGAWARTHQAVAAAAQGNAGEAADALRAAYRTATSLGAQRLISIIEQSAIRARLSLDEPAAAQLGPDAASKLGLTPREDEVLGLVSAGLTNREIGERLFVSEKTASVHVSNILRKLGVATRIDAAALAQRAALT
jgi:DNA-binding NarL/FixJ family response regulator